MWLTRWVYLVGAFLILVTSMAPASIAGNLTLYPATSFNGRDYKTLKNIPLSECIATCEQDAACNAFTYNEKAKWCFLKKGAEFAQPFQGAVSGVAPNGIVQGYTLYDPPEPLALPDVIVQNSKNYQQELLKDLPPSIGHEERQTHILQYQTFETLITNQNYAEALSYAKMNLRNARGNFKAWYDLTTTLYSLAPTDPTASNSYTEELLLAAYQTYLTSDTSPERAESLMLLGIALNYNGQGRLTVPVYMKALRFSHRDEIKKALRKAEADYGFRITDTRVNAEAADPQICIQFSEKIKQGRVDFSPFFTSPNTPKLGIIGHDQEICLTGFARGERTEITVREGLPAFNDTVLSKPVTLSFFVKERTPFARFSGQNYILPSTMRQGIPVTSLNSQALNIALYFIPDRGLTSSLRNTRFLRQIAGYEAHDIINTTGEKTWEGQLLVKRKSGEEVTTSLPLDAMLKNRKPGIYLMTAKPDEIKAEEDRGNNLATQWLLVSDIGLTSLTSQQDFIVFARSLQTAKTLKDIKISVVARNNDILATATTDENGMARFDGKLMQLSGGRTPILITATKADDYNLLDLTTSAYDLSDRGTSGRAPPGPVDLFVYTDRGIYQPGHTVHLNALARNEQTIAVNNLPLTMILERPDGAEYQRYSLNDQGSGSYDLAIELKKTAMRGNWKARFYTDPKQPPLYTHIILVDDFIPERIEVNLKASAAELDLTGTTKLLVASRFLYGAPATELAVEGEIILKVSSSLAAFPGYVFGDLVTPPPPAITKLGEGLLTDAQGQLEINLKPAEMPVTSGTLTADLIMRVREESGRLVEEQLTLPTSLMNPVIGIKSRAMGEGLVEKALFDVIAVGVDQKLTSMPLKWRLVRLNHDYHWYSRSGYWYHEPVTTQEQIANGQFVTSNEKPQSIEANVEWGQYRLIVESDDPTGPISSYDFNAGSYRPTLSADTPDIVRMSFDKPSYKIGDKATIKIMPAFAGTALVNIVAEKLIAMQAIEVPATGTEVSFNITEDWVPGTYATISLIRPMTENGSDQKLPRRALGVAPLVRDETARTLAVTLSPPPQIRSRTTLKVPVKIDNAKSGEDIFVTLSAVDVGVLNVTKFTPPDVDGWYYGQRRLAFDMRDIYGRLIDGALGETGQLRSGGGGDDEGEGINSVPPLKIVAQYSGIIRLAADGTSEVEFDIPEFNGTLRLMAVAWTKTKVGDTHADVIVRDPVVITEGLPRILAPQDQTRLNLTFDNRDGPEGAYSLEVTTTEGLEIKEAKRSLNLLKDKRQSLSFPLLAKSLGEQSLNVRLSHESGLEINRSFTLFVRPGQTLVSTVDMQELAPGQSLKINPRALAQVIKESASLTVSASRLEGIDVPSLLMKLDRYPYGCTEQTTSRALPLLYLNQVAVSAGMETDTALKQRVQEAIYHVLANQSSSGSFSLWGRYDYYDDVWLSAYATDFLTQAKEQGYDVPEASLQSALASLQNALNSAQADIDNDVGVSSQMAYALYVLARNKQAQIADLRYFAETKMETFPTSIARAQLAAALALYGDKIGAKKALKSAVSLVQNDAKYNYALRNYGSDLRDTAAMIYYSNMIDPQNAVIPVLLKRLTQLQDRYTSTQEESWLLLAAHSILSTADGGKIKVNGEEHESNFYKFYKNVNAATLPTLTNETNKPLTVITTTTAVPLIAPPEEGEGFTIERKYYDMKGGETELKTVKQNDRFVVVLKVKRFAEMPANIMITDLLPAGFEIENPTLISSAQLSNFGWVPEPDERAHLEFRSDRFAAALTQEENDNKEIILAYIVRAITPGRFTHPAAHVEDMYKPYLHAQTARGELIIE